MSSRKPYGFKGGFEVFGTLPDKAIFPSFPPVPEDLLSTADYGNMGKYFVHYSGNVYRKVRLISGTANKGYVLAWAGSALGALTATIASYDDATNAGKITLTLSASGTFAKNALRDCYLCVPSSAANPYGIVREILGNDATTSTALVVKIADYMKNQYTDPKYLDANKLIGTTGKANSMPTVGTAVSILYPTYYVVLAPTSGSIVPVGIALGTVDATSEHKATYVQTYGLGHIYASGATNVNQYLQCGTVAGQATATASPIGHLYVGYSLLPMAAAGLNVAHIQIPAQNAI